MDFISSGENCPQQAGPESLFELFRGHWGIENSLFHVKDDSFGENRHVLHSHRSGFVVSLLRNTAITLLRAQYDLWKDREPLTARNQRVCAHPAPLLSAITRLRNGPGPKHWGW